MATSPVTIPPNLFNPSGAMPEKPAGISDEEWTRIINQLRTADFYDSNPELRGTVPPAPTKPGVTAGAPASSPGAAPPLPASQIPAVPTQGVVPANIVSQGVSQTVAPKSFATSLLSRWLDPNIVIPAASTIGGTLVQRSAANHATDAQTEAADRALALTKEMYEQDRADYKPYRDIGAFSLGQLGHLTGMPSNFGGAAVDAATAPRTAIPRDGGTDAASQGLTPWPANQPTRDPMFRTAGYGPEFQSLRDLGARQQSASSFVRMRAPTGEEEDVDPSEVQFFESHGATRI